MLNQAEIVSIYMSHDISMPYMDPDEALSHDGLVGKKILGFVEIKNADEFTSLGVISDIKIDNKTYTFIVYAEFQDELKHDKAIIYIGANFKFARHFSCIYQTFSIFKDRKEGIELIKYACENGIWFKEQASAMTNVSDHGYFHDDKNNINTLR